MTLRLLGIGPGDEVITCAYTYTATASVVCHVGAKLVLVDCSESSGSVEMDYDAMEAEPTEKAEEALDAYKKLAAVLKTGKRNSLHSGQ